MYESLGYVIIGIFVVCTLVLWLMIKVIDEYPDIEIGSIWEYYGGAEGKVKVIEVTEDIVKVEVIVSPAWMPGSMQEIEKEDFFCDYDEVDDE